MNKSIRIKTNPVEESTKYITVKLDQDFDTLDILSLKIGQEDIYNSFNADYGVLIGRVVGNGRIGVPNAKISVFIPITDEDALRPEIQAIYPYKTPRDLDQEGRKYNLLPRVSVNNPFITEGQNSPVTPVGSFPTKEEIYTNPSYLEVYGKYYKYSTVSNNSGDYMIYGVPVGVYDVHMSVDITDIGTFSMTPGTMVNQLGYSPNLFTSDGRIKENTDMDILPNVELQNIPVNIVPFWGDRENYEIGITRQDFKIRTVLTASFTIFGSAFTDARSAGWGQNGDLNRMIVNEDVNDSVGDRIKYNLEIANKRIGDFNISVFTYPESVSDEDINSGNVDTTRDIVELDSTEYTEYLEDGQFILTLPCNRRKKITNELGELIDTSSDDPNGIFSEFKGFLIIKYAEELDNILKRDRSNGDRIDIVRIKIPQTAALGQTFTFERDSSTAARNEAWRKQYHTFEYGKFYTISKFHATIFGATGSNRAYGPLNEINRNPQVNSGCIVVNSSESLATSFPTNANTFLDTGNLESNSSDLPVSVFGAEWLNMCMYLPQFRVTTSETTDISDSVTDYKDDVNGMVVVNNNKVAGFMTDTSMFLRSDYHKTQFVEVPREDLVSIIQNVPDQKGFTSIDEDFDASPLSTNYPSTTGIKYFYRGHGTSDVIDFLIRKGLISVV